jgi:type I restriction enzyme S subunit
MREGWKYSKLGEVSFFSRGLTFSKDDVAVESSKKVLRSNNIDLATHSLNFDDVACLKEEFVIPSDKKLHQNDIFICMSNGSTQHLGKVAFIEKDLDYAFGGFMGAIHPQPSAIYPKFAFYYCMSSEYRRSLASVLNGININNLKWSDLSKFPIPVPPLSEQQRIVSELDLLSSIIEKKKAQLKEYDQLAQSIFYDMFGDPVANEKGWEVVKLGELTEVGTGSTPDRKNESYYLGNNPWIKSTEVCNCAIYDVQEHISDDALKDTNCTLYPENTILIAMYGQGKTRGQVAIMKLEACTNQAVAAILPSSKIEPMFLYQHLHLMYEHIRSLARGGNQSNLNLFLVKSIKIMVPPLHLQQSFASKIEAIERQKALIQQSIAEVQMLFDSRMDDWFA